jgi:prefoldin subunit 5
MEEASLPVKVLKYEEFLNEKLRPDLKKVLDEDDKLCTEIANCLQVKEFLHQLKNKTFGNEDDNIKVKTDLGCNFFVEAVLEDTSNVYVYLGLGIYLQMTREEAIAFIGKRQKVLEGKRTVLIEKASTIKAHIKLVLEGLRELQGISAETIKDPQQTLSHLGF